MMNAKEIQNKQFEKAKIGGYKLEEVDAFLTEVYTDYSQLQKEKSELERKLEVLADKIREYREDEDALKDALLVAQRQGNAIVADSKASADKLTKETKEKVEKMLAESKAKSERLVNEANEYSARTRAEAEAAAEKTIKDANDKAAEIKAAMDQQQAIQEEILQKTRKEVYEYRTKILNAYKAQMELIEKMPEECENEFVKRTAEETEKREAERRKAEEQKAAKAKAEAARSAAAQAKVKEAADKAAAALKAEGQQPVQQPKQAQPKPVQPKPEAAKPAPKSGAKNAGAQKPAPAPKPVVEESPVVPVPDRTAENNLPFFNTESQAPVRHENLQFGKNNNGNN